MALPTSRTVMSSVIPKDLRLRGLAACALLIAAAACGGGDDSAQAAAPAKAGDSAAAPTAPVAAAPADTPVPAPAAQPNAAILDSAMTPQRAAEVAKAQAPVQGPVNVEVLADYELTMPRVRQLVEGSKNLALLQERRPELRDSMMIRTADPNLLFQRINSIPEAREALAQAGLTPQAYATGTAALLQGIMIYEVERRGGQPPPVQFNEKNVDFIAEHIQDIMQLMQEARASMPAQGRPPRP